MWRHTTDVGEFIGTRMFQFTHSPGGYSTFDRPPVRHWPVFCGRQWNRFDTSLLAASIGNLPTYSSLIAASATDVVAIHICPLPWHTRDTPAVH